MTHLQRGSTSNTISRYKECMNAAWDDIFSSLQGVVYLALLLPWFLLAAPESHSSSVCFSLCFSSSYSFYYLHRLIIRCTTLLPSFFSRNSRLYCKKLVIHLWFKVLSIAGHYFLRVAYESRVEKTDHLLRLSTNRSNFLPLHKTGSAGQPGRVPLIETSDSQRKQHLENTAGGVGLPISTFPSMSWPLSQHGVEHCHAAKSLYVSLVVLQPFVFQCSAQTHQLRSIPIACDCFSRF